MLTLISAPPRTGKTLKMMEIIFSHLNEGRPVYTNIVGINLVGVFVLDTSTPHDWRDLPNNSVVIYDEAHEHPAFSDLDLLRDLTPDLSDLNKISFKVTNSIFDSEMEVFISNYLKLNDFPTEMQSLIFLEIKEKKVYSKDLIKLLNGHIEILKKKRIVRAKDDILDIGRSLTLHGHFGMDIYMITQNPRLLSAHVLASVGRHLFMRRLWGLDMATIFEYAEAKTSFTASVRKEALNITHWRYPKHLYKYYISSEHHNIKKTFPKKYLAFAFIPLIIFGYVYHNMTQSKTGFFGVVGDEKRVQLSSDKPTDSSGEPTYPSNKPIHSSDKPIHSSDYPLSSSTPLPQPNFSSELPPHSSLGSITVDGKKTCYDSMAQKISCGVSL